MAWAGVKITQPFVKAFSTLDRNLQSKVEDLLEALNGMAPESDWRLPEAVPIDSDGFEVTLSDTWMFQYRLIYDGHLVRQLRRIDVNLAHPRKPLELRF